MHNYRYRPHLWIRLAELQSCSFCLCRAGNTYKFRSCTCRRFVFVWRLAACLFSCRRGKEPDKECTHSNDCGGHSCYTCLPAYKCQLYVPSSNKQDSCFRKGSCRGYSSCFAIRRNDSCRDHCNKHTWHNRNIHAFLTKDLLRNGK